MLQKIGGACASPASNTKAWTSSAYFEQTKLNVMDLKVHHWTHWACDSCPSSLIWFHHSGIWCTTNNKPIVWHRYEAWSISKENLSSLSDLASYPAPDPLPCTPRQYACLLSRLHVFNLTKTWFGRGCWWTGAQGQEKEEWDWCTFYAFLGLGNSKSMLWK